MASVHEVDSGNYRVDICRKRVDGTQGRLSRTIAAKSAADAKRQAGTMEADYIRMVGEFAPPAPVPAAVPTLNDVVEQWREIEASNDKLASKTLERYEGMLKQFILPTFGNQNINEISVADIKKYTASLEKNGIRKDGKPGGYSQKTIRAHYLLLQHLFNFAIEMGMLQVTPFSRMKTPTVDKHEANYLNPVQIDDTLNALDQMCANTISSFSTSIKYDRMGAEEAEKNQMVRCYNDSMHRIYIWLALTTGGRRSELTGLHWTDVDFDAELITIRHTLHYTSSKGIYEVSKLKNGDASKVIPIVSAVAKKLMQYKKQQEQLFQHMGWHDNGFVFTSIRPGKQTVPGGHILPDAISKWFSGFIENYGLANITLHDVRHSCISYLLNQGVPVEVVAKIAGHNPNVTREIYEHIYPTAKREAVDKFGSLLDGRV